MIKHLCKLVWNRKRVNFLIMVEIFCSFLVVFAVIVFAVHYSYNYRQPLGFEYRNVWYVGIDPKAGMDRAQRPSQMATMRQLLAALREFDEVEAAAGLWAAPYSPGDWTSGYKLNGRDVDYHRNQATDDLPQVFGLRLTRGRWFGKDDDGAAYIPVVINQRFAGEQFGGEDPLGKDVSDPSSKERREMRVVGVIGDFRENGEFSDLSNYLFERHELSGATTAELPRSFVIKVRPGTKADFEEKLLKRLLAEARDWSFQVRSLVEMRESNFKSYLIPMLGFGLIAGFLLIMVGLGLTGVLWQNVTQRTKEIGLRRAKGATAGRIYRQILGELLVITTFGLLVGVALVAQFPLLSILGFVSGQVYVFSLLTSLALIYGLTILCGLYPSWLATRVQPAAALHYE